MPRRCSPRSTGAKRRRNPHERARRAKHCSGLPTCSRTRASWTTIPASSIRKTTLEDEVYGASLRPRTFDEYVGQERVVENLRIAIDAAKRRGEPLEHVLFYGPPGSAKTTLAALIASELGANFRPTSGPTLEKPKDLVGILTSLEEGDVLFIDEIHRLGGVVEEFLYPAMEDFQIDFVVDRGAYAKTLKLPLTALHAVGATTRAGHADRAAARALRHRRIISTTTPPEDLERIVRRRPGVLGRADRCRRRRDDRGAQPRDAAHREPAAAARARLCRGARRRPITPGSPTRRCAREGVDELGLDRLDRAFLRTIAEQYRGGPVGIDAIAATLDRRRRDARRRRRAVPAQRWLRHAHGQRPARDRACLPASRRRGTHRPRAGAAALSGR